MKSLPKRRRASARARTDARPVSHSSQPGGEMADCLFCRIIAGEVPGTIVHRDERLTAFRDIQPQAPTHILIVPNCHLTSTADATDEHRELFGEMVLFAADLARREGISVGGYRLVVNTGPN